MTNTQTGRTTSTHDIDGQTIESEQANCANCGERIARGSARGTRAWRHMLTMSGLCASGESCADPDE